MPTFHFGRFVTGRAWCAVLLVSAAAHAAAQGDDGESHPDTIRVQTLGKTEPSATIRIPGYSYLGSPVFSKDGEWIAFDAYKAGNEAGECWIVRRDGSGLKRLARGGTVPRWSPDGKRLLFMRETKIEAAANLGIFVIDRDGTGEKRLCEGRWPDWSPDGKHIAYSKGGRGDQGGTRSLSRVYVAQHDGTNEELLGDGDGPSWSPDGKSIACCQADPAFPAPLIRVIDVHDGSQRILGYGWWRANWSPDSREVVTNGILAGNRVGMIRLAVGVPNAKVQPLLAGGPDGLSPCLSFDGKQVVFAAPRAKEPRIDQ